jgi:hypothetical protein
MDYYDLQIQKLKLENQEKMIILAQNMVNLRNGKKKRLIARMIIEKKIKYTHFLFDVWQRL